MAQTISLVLSSVTKLCPVIRTRLSRAYSTMKDDVRDSFLRALHSKARHEEVGDNGHMKPAQRILGPAYGMRENLAGYFECGNSRPSLSPG
jgi:hypothetical protein